MPDIIADRPRRPVISLLPEQESSNLNRLILTFFSSRAPTRARFATGRFGNPSGRRKAAEYAALFRPRPAAVTCFG
jgi:hypothetical protein